MENASHIADLASHLADVIGPKPRNQKSPAHEYDCPFDMKGLIQSPILTARKSGRHWNR